MALSSGGKELSRKTARKKGNAVKVPLGDEGDAHGATQLIGDA